MNMCGSRVCCTLNGMGMETFYCFRDMEMGLTLYAMDMEIGFTGNGMDSKISFSKISFTVEYILLKIEGALS